MKLSPSSFYSVKELCELLRIKKGTAWKWANDRKFATTKIGGKLMFYANSVNEEIEANRKRSLSELKEESHLRRA